MVPREESHSQILPECKIEHGVLWTVVWSISGTFFTLMCLCIPMVIANVNDLKKEDVAIRSEQSRYEQDNASERNKLVLERQKQFAAMDQKITDGFNRIDIKLAILQASIDEHMKEGKK